MAKQQWIKVNSWQIEATQSALDDTALQVKKPLENLWSHLKNKCRMLSTRLRGRKSIVNM